METQYQKGPLINFTDTGYPQIFYSLAEETQGILWLEEIQEAQGILHL